MEPADLNPHSAAREEDRRLEALLRAAQPSLPDDDFSQRVLAALPPPRRVEGRVFSRVVAVVLGALAGSAVAWNRGVTLVSLSAARAELHDSLLTASVPFANTGMLVALAVTALSLFYAFRQPRRSSRFI